MFACRLVAVLLWIGCCASLNARPVAPSALAGFVEANGVRLEYRDWGGSGPDLVLVSGYFDDPHVYDDIAPALTDRFHVVSYARRAIGNSQAKGPYDALTLTEDLRGLMDALGIARAHLIGWSAGGNEITEMAAAHPERVRSLVFLDAGYDWSDPDFLVAYKARPVFERPQSAMASFDAYRSYQKSMWYASVADMGRLEAHLRTQVVIQTDGSVRERLPKEIKDAFYAALFANKPRRYTEVRCPVLAIYAQHWYQNDMTDLGERRKALAYDKEFDPFRIESMDRIRREIPGSRVMTVPGAHSNLIFVSREPIVTEIRRFLGVSSSVTRRQ